ncbi:hypothetical protein BU26DRAFT_183951 [Trematosphaeria pertusa]|uniref:Uncharacterized protein n=1 Tax=Trematosphaeria pertusa TaxID=390896 RepID=A0A6A6HU25_9PLEO|nr:uncharacterized protein BU26DRAFT_183951 [Trematosphaeria pertusa]KAF2241258.1 hypothetical protein BU26DRAFT_183951 [Trematosphaeria pertusa]
MVWCVGSDATSCLVSHGGAAALAEQNRQGLRHYLASPFHLLSNTHALAPLRTASHMAAASTTVAFARIRASNGHRRQPCWRAARVSESVTMSEMVACFGHFWRKRRKPRYQSRGRRSTRKAACQWPPSIHHISSLCSAGDGAGRLRYVPRLMRTSIISMAL